MQGDATIEVTLNDVNDNAPLFSEASFTYSVDEQDVSTDIFLLTIAASDSDGTSPNNMLIYNITGGNDDGKFTIDNTNVSFYFTISYYCLCMYVDSIIQ